MYALANTASATVVKHEESAALSGMSAYIVSGSNAHMRIALDLEAWHENSCAYVYSTQLIDVGSSNSSIVRKLLVSAECDVAIHI